MTYGNHGYSKENGEGGKNMVGEPLGMQCRVCIINYENRLKSENNEKQRGIHGKCSSTGCGEDYVKGSVAYKAEYVTR